MNLATVFTFGLTMRKQAAIDYLFVYRKLSMDYRKKTGITKSSRKMHRSLCRQCGLRSTGIGSTISVQHTHSV